MSQVKQHFCVIHSKNGEPPWSSPPSLHITMLLTEIIAWIQHTAECWPSQPNCCEVQDHMILLGSTPTMMTMTKMTTVRNTKARFPFKRNRLRCVRCVHENRKKRKRLRWQAANHSCHCFDRAFLLAGACVCCVKISRNKCKRQPIGMLGRSSGTGNHDRLLANASACVSCGFRVRNARNASDCVWMETGLEVFHATQICWWSWSYLWFLKGYK